MPSISMLVPAYNEEAGLAATIARCQDTLRKATGDYEIIICDDCSADATAALMERLRAADPAHIRTIRHERNRGIAYTFEELYAAAAKDYAFLIPGDGEYPPEALLEAIPLLADHEIVVCRRVRKNYTLYRHIISNAYRWLTRFLFGVELYDPGTTKIVKREIYTSVPVTCKSVYVEAERMIRAVKRGYRLAKIDIVQETRKGGVARGARWATVSAAGKDLVRLWWQLTVLRGRP